MLKRKIVLFLSLALAVTVALAACGGGGGNSPAPAATTAATTAAAAVATTAAAVATTAAAAAEAPADGSDKSVEGLVEVLDEGDFVETLKGEGSITLRYAMSGTGGQERLVKALQPFVDDTGISIDLIRATGSWADYFTKIQLMIAAGETIDVALAAIEGYEMLIQLGLAAPIDDWIANNAEEWNVIANDISPAVMDIHTFRGEIYGAPMEWNNVVTHINTAMLEDAGLEIPSADWSKETFLEYAHAMTKTREDGTKQFGVFVPNYYFGFQGWLFNHDTTYMSADFTESNLNDPHVEEALKLMQDLIYVYEVAPKPEPGLDSGLLFRDGLLGMHFAGRWPTTQYYENEFKDVTVQYLPEFVPGVKRNTTWGGQVAFTMKGTKHFDEAVRLALYIASPTFIESWMTYGAIPVLNSVAAKLVPSLGVPHNAELFITSAEVARAVQSPSQYAECESLMNRVFSDVLISQRDVKEVLAEAHAELNMILLDNK